MFWPGLPKTNFHLLLIKIQIAIKQILVWASPDQFPLFLIKIWIEIKEIMAWAAPD